ncbi:MAG: hypothetical protein AAF799_37140 [Myxococcota bacterium]
MKVTIPAQQERVLASIALLDSKAIVQSPEQVAIKNVHKISEVQWSACDPKGLHPFRWCHAEPLFDGPHLDLRSGVEIASGYVLTTLHGLQRFDKKTSFAMVRGYHADKTKVSKGNELTIDGAEVLHPNRIHCIPGQDTVLVVADGAQPNPKAIAVSEKVTALKNKKLKRVKAYSVAFPLGVPALVDQDPYVSSNPVLDGDKNVIGHKAAIDVMNGSSGGGVYERATGHLLGLISGAETVEPAARSTGNSVVKSKCCWIPKNSNKVPQGRVHLIDEDQLKTLIECREESGCIRANENKWRASCSAS